MSESPAMGQGPRWRYRAARADGVEVRGDVEAATEREAADALRRQALWAIELVPADGRARPAPAFEPRAFGGRWRRLSDAAIALPLRTMATLVDGGVPLASALTFAADQAPDPALAAALTAVREAITRGTSLGDAVEAQSVLPPVCAGLIRAGEATGTLGRSLLLLANTLDAREAVRRRVHTALLYPAILAGASVAGVTLILLVVVPRFASLITEGGGTLPLSTRLLLGVSTLAARAWWLVPVGVAIALALRSRMQRAGGAHTLDAWRLKTPGLGALDRTRASAAYTATLAVALEAGVPLLRAMALARDAVGNRALREALATAELAIRDGRRVADAVTGILPALTERLLAAGEATGDLAGMSRRAAEAAEQELERAVGRAVALIEPVVILGFGGVVGFVALALLQAIYGLNAGVL